MGEALGRGQADPEPGERTRADPHDNGAEVGEPDAGRREDAVDPDEQLLAVPVARGPAGVGHEPAGSVRDADDGPRGRRVDDQDRASVGRSGGHPVAPR